MEKAFRPIPLETLARWIFRELDGGETVLGIPRQNLEVPDPRLASTFLGQALAAPLGVAAGPQTQLAQNLAAAWLCGARFLELKTVQVLDQIKVARPCIDAEDATYNCEWSQELSLDESFQEYLHGWVLIWAMAHKLGLKAPGTLFNMSVGYDLAGIQGERVQRFIARMRDAGDALARAVETVAKVYPPVRDLPIPARLSNHVTLSTMHGCPPAETERIARYLLCDLGVHTWVKLNPTLLGPERLRGLLNERLGHDIEVPDAAFAHDPRFGEAMAMVENLAAAARGREATFGVKLSNTLEVVNRRPVFPAAEKMMYLSGRALHPLTLTLAGLVAEATRGRVPLSFCGGADATNFADLVADGLWPVTVCTDLLKPGGYARLQQYLVNLELAMARAGAEDLQAFVGAPAQAGARLAAHAARVPAERRFARRERQLVAKGARPLGHFDCVAAPCMEGCPAHQNIPDYLWHVANGDPQAALEVIERTNAMPAVTGSVCDHPCTDRCVRNHYDAPLAIREVKRFAVEHAQRRPAPPAPSRSVRVAVVGAGPAGVACALALRQEGFSVTVFEAREVPGGMVKGVIPAYRLAAPALEQDLARLRLSGAELRLGKRLGRGAGAAGEGAGALPGAQVTLDGLRAEGFAHVFLAVGAQAGKKLGIPGETAEGVLDALAFLERACSGEPAGLGRRVLVVGGGNSAMDAARTARRLAGEGSVTLVYRRTRAQMPADPTEVEACVEEGIGLRDLLAPLRIAVEDGKVKGLVCQQMKLGPPDASGRPRPVPVPGAEVLLPCDTLIPAISQEPVLDFLAGRALARTREGGPQVDPETLETSEPGLFAGGDLVRGPSSVIQAIADGRAAAAEIARRHGVVAPPEPHLDKGLSPARLLEKRSRTGTPRTVPVLPVPERKGFAEVLGAFDAATAAIEASRCLDCDELCSLCVTVCPNRANLAWATAPLSIPIPSLVSRSGKLAPDGSTQLSVEQGVQIAHLADACNQCGNCTTFCPTAGAPWRDKPRFWLDAEGFASAEGDAFRFTREGEALVLEARLAGRACRLEQQNGEAVYRDDRVSARFRIGSWQLIEAAPAHALAEGERVELAAFGTLAALLDTAPILP